MLGVLGVLGVLGGLVVLVVLLCARLWEVECASSLSVV
jgi:hypothetical protein